MKKLIKFFIFISFLCWLCPGVLFADKTGNIGGLVFDDTTGTGMAGVTVKVNHTSLATSSDNNGNFSLHNVPEGTDTITFSILGYEDQKVVVDLKAGEFKKITTSLKTQVIFTGEILIYGQEKGQKRAIQEQFDSPLILNVVSGAKMQEFPDANAAEAIGRLPGISLNRSNGEAYQVVVRGLDAKFNYVTLEGFKIPSTNFQDRSVDLSIMPSELFSGVEVFKALRADLDANALGGTVNLRLPKAPQLQKFELSAIGGYTFLDDSHNNYKVSVGYSNRFFRKKLGLSFRAFRELKDRPQQMINANYGTPANTDTGLIVKTNYVKLEWEELNTTRSSIDLILDYGNDWWDVKYFGLFNQKIDRTLDRQNSIYFIPSLNNNQGFDMNVQDQTSIINTMMHTLQNEFRIGSTKLDLSLNFSWVNTRMTEQQFPFNYQNPSWNFSTTLYGDPLALYDQIGRNTNIQAKNNEYISNFNYDGVNLLDKNLGFNLDYEIPYNILDKIIGKIKFGGKFFQLTRVSEGEGASCNFANNSPGTFNKTAINTLFPTVHGGLSQPGLFATNYQDMGYHPPKFIGGYDLPWGANVGMLTDEQAYCIKHNSLDYYPSGNNEFNNTYSNTENQGAGYFMTEFTVDKKLTVAPGIRYEKNTTSYTAYIVRGENTPTGIDPPWVTTTKRSQDDWFPSINLKYQVDKHFNILGAFYRSTTRPDFQDISPAQVFPYEGSDVIIYNPYLKDATAWNYDLGISYLDPNIGLIAINGFYKDIQNLVVYMANDSYHPSADTIPIFNAPAGFNNRLMPPSTYFHLPIVSGNWAANSFPINNPNDATVKGLEFSWQTNLWYLSGLLKGVVLDINYTLIKSSTLYPFIYTPVSNITGQVNYATYGTKEGPLKNQPASKLNASLGWDYKGFGIRVSFIYQAKTLQVLDATHAVFDSYTTPIKLLDLQLTQKVTHYVTLFANLSNITQYVDQQYFSAQPQVAPSSSNPDGSKARPARLTYSDFYGTRGEIGIRLNL